jgi:hypothetical protein
MRARQALNGWLLGAAYRNAPAGLQVTGILRQFLKKVANLSNIFARLASIVVRAVEVNASRGEI